MHMPEIHFNKEQVTSVPRKMKEAIGKFVQKKRDQWVYPVSSTVEQEYDSVRKLIANPELQNEMGKFTAYIRPALARYDKQAAFGTFMGKGIKALWSVNLMKAGSRLFQQDKRLGSVLFAAGVLTGSDVVFGAGQSPSTRNRLESIRQAGEVERSVFERTTTPEDYPASPAVAASVAVPVLKGLTSGLNTPLFDTLEQSVKAVESAGGMAKAPEVANVTIYYGMPDMGSTTGASDESGLNDDLTGQMQPDQGSDA